MFKIREIGETPEGTVGIIKDDEGTAVQAFLRKQYDPDRDPQWAITESIYGVHCITEGVEPDRPETFMVLTERGIECPLDFTKYANHEDEEVLETFFDDLDAAIENLPDGSLVLTGDPNTVFSSFALALKHKGEWWISGCGYCDYDYASSAINVEWNLDRADGDDECDPDMEFAGSVHLLPYTIDTSVSAE